MKSVILQTEAIVLQIRPWSKTSHMVTWLTRQQGRLTTSVKGACRPKSAFLGQYDLFYTCDLLFYHRETEGIHILRECTSIERRDPLRENWRAATVAAYLCDLTARAVSVQTHEVEIYHLLTRTLDQLAAPTAHLSWLALILRYELQLLRFLGHLPDSKICPACHATQEWLRFSLPGGHFLCQHRSPVHPSEATLAVSRGVQEGLALLAESCEGSMTSAPMSLPPEKIFPVSSHLMLGLSRFLGIFITFHLDVPASVRRVALEMIDKTHAHANAFKET